MTGIGFRWSAAVAIAGTWLLFVIGGFVVAFDPVAGNPDAVAGGFYYAGMVLAVLALPALVIMHLGRLGRAGSVGFVLAQVGVVMYGTGAFLVLPLVSDIAGAHDVFLFAATEVPVFPVGALLFFVGTTMLGIAVARAGVIPRIAGMLFGLGATLWLVAFFAPASFNTKALFVANLIGAAGAFLIAAAVVRNGADAG